MVASLRRHGRPGHLAPTGKKAGVRAAQLASSLCSTTTEIRNSTSQLAGVSRRFINAVVLVTEHLPVHELYLVESVHLRP